MQKVEYTAIALTLLKWASEKQDVFNKSTGPRAIQLPRATRFFQPYGSLVFALAAAQPLSEM